MLHGVMRVGLVAKGLLLKGDSNLELVLLCSAKPTVSLLKGVAEKLTAQLEVQHRDHNTCCWTCIISEMNSFPFYCFCFSFNRKTQREHIQLASVQGTQRSPWRAPNQSWHSPYTWHRLLSGLRMRVPAQQLQRELEVQKLSQPPVSQPAAILCLLAVAMQLWILTLRSLQ